MEVRAFRILIEESAFSLVILVCSPKLRLGSRVIPKILGFLTVGMMILLIVRFSVASCSRVQDVKRVAVDLSGFKISSFFFVHSKISWRYGCKSCSASDSSNERRQGSCRQNMHLVKHLQVGEVSQRCTD